LAPVPAPAGLLAGQRKQVTVLFADFSGFTSFAERQDPEDLHAHMSSLWQRLDALISAHGGTVEKHIGDAMMAVFGARQAREDDPARAVRAALAMQLCLATLPGYGGQPPLQMRIGVHTGLVLVAPGGTDSELTATGDTVNLASRLEQHAPVGGVLISHQTYRLVYGLFEVKQLPPLTVKGKPEPLQTYRVLNARPRSLAQPIRGVEGVETQMVGRELELKRLQSAFQSVIEKRQAQVITVLGDAGIGKSCLLTEFRRWVEASAQTVRFFCGRATAQTGGLPFSLLRDVFAIRFDILESDSSGVAREKFERGFVGLLEASGVAPGQGPRSEAHFIGQVLGLDFSSSPFLRQLLHDAEQIRDRAFHYLGRFFRAAAEAGRLSATAASGAAASLSALTGETAPLGRLVPQAALMIVEDIHWGDDGSLDLINYLAEVCQDTPLLVVCSARPSLLERRPAWGEGSPVQARLRLDSLSCHESQLLVGTILRKTPVVPEALRQLIVSAAEGSPFYIEEMIKMLIDQQVILPGPSRWRIELERLASAQVPSTLTGILQARLDALGPSERAVVQRASVVGRIFWDSAIEWLSDPGHSSEGDETANHDRLSQAQVGAALEGLRRKEIIFRRESSAFAGAVEYAFKHELLRNVSYEGLLKRLRREHHARVAAWLIQRSGERVSEFSGLVAAHYEQAGRLAEAAEWHGRAAQQARASYAPATAVEHFGKAVALLPVDRLEDKAFRARQIEWQEGLGENLGALAQFDEASQAYDAMRSLAEASGDVLAQSRAWNGLAFLHERRGSNRASIESAERAESLAKQAGELGLREQARALHLKGWAAYRLGDASAVLALGQQTLNLCAELEDQRGLADSFKLHGVAHLLLGHFADADRYFQQGLALSQECNDRRTVGAMWSNLGESARLRGDYQAAAEYYDKALAVVRQIGNRDSETIYLVNLSGARLGLGEVERAESGLREVINRAGAFFPALLSEAYSLLSEACLRQGKLADALQAAQQALPLAQGCSAQLELGRAWRALGKAAGKMIHGSQQGGQAREALPEARKCFAESLRIFEQIHAQAEQAHTLRAWAECERMEGREIDSERKDAAARAMFADLGMLDELETSQPAVPKSESL